jgi:transposase
MTTDQIRCRRSAGPRRSRTLHRTHDQHQAVGAGDHTIRRAAGAGPPRPAGLWAATAAKIIGETAGIDRFKSRDAYAHYNGTAPLPVWSANKARHRLSRTGNRQLNAALHRTALTQARWHPNAQALIQRRRSNGDSGREAVRILKRHLSDAVF